MFDKAYSKARHFATVYDRSEDRGTIRYTYEVWQLLVPHDLGAVVVQVTDRNEDDVVTVGFDTTWQALDYATWHAIHHTLPNVSSERGYGEEF